ncbi:unnamed protein product [Lactuca virosa]|uniref:RRM domain-containing protein n=1 Tax=Lactuca virosa TaxID=75947 RepID=A0AAU9LIB1_9ASTR|nr:unnamed protein product [Lactuca virosa]
MLSKAFRKFGKIVDIYIPGRKDKAGSYFAFVKYEGIKDVQVMLNSLNQIRCGHCIMKINIAKYEKKRNHKIHGQAFHHVRPPQINKDVGGWKKTSEGKSFADVVTGKTNTSKTPLVNLKRVPVMESDWLLLGEVSNFQHLSNLPKLLNVDGEVPCHVFYAGGLKVLLRFSSQDAATRYLKNENTWNRWFRWLKSEIIDNLPFERMAWVKVIGLPIHLRSEENVSLVVGRLGRIVEVDGCQNWHNIDLTSSHARILTGDKLLINKEINCSFNGKNYTVGVVECEDIWQPFSKYYESDSETSTKTVENDDEIEKSDSDDDGISETWENVNHMDVEEGEIVMDAKVIDNPDAVGGVVASPSPAISDGVAYIENQNFALNTESDKSPRDNNIINTENSKELSNTDNINVTDGNLDDQITRNHVMGDGVSNGDQ